MKKKYLVINFTEGKETKKKEDIITDIYFYEDVFKYSNNEYFIDITNYEELYKKTPYQQAQSLLNKFKKLKITCLIGLGTNLFLAKTACNIIAQDKKLKIAYLDEKEYLSICSKIKPLSKFWQISDSMTLKLKTLNIYTMEDIRNANYQKLYNIFGLNAEYLINHSLGLENTTIKELKEKKQPKRIVSSLTLSPLKNKQVVTEELKKLLDFNILKLKEQGLLTKTIYLYIKYKNNIIPKEIIPIKLNKETNSYNLLMNLTTNIFINKANIFMPIEKIAISFNDISEVKEIDTYYPKNRKINILKSIFTKEKLNLYNLTILRT